MQNNVFCANSVLKRGDNSAARVSVPWIFRRFEAGSYRSVPSDYTVQMEAEEEREALIINPSEHVVVRKVREWKPLKTLNYQLLKSGGKTSIISFCWGCESKTRSCVNRARKHTAYVQVKNVCNHIYTTRVAIKYTVSALNYACPKWSMDIYVCGVA